MIARNALDGELSHAGNNALSEGENRRADAAGNIVLRRASQRIERDNVSLVVARMIV